MTGDRGTLERPAPDRPAVDPLLVARVTERLALAGDAPTAAAVTTALRHEGAVLGGPGVLALVAEVRSELTGFGPLEPLLADPEVSDVLVNGPGEVWVERHGCLARSGLVIDRDAFDALVERSVAAAGRRVDRASPIVDLRLHDGSRVNVVLAPLAVDGPCVTIRRFGARAVPLDAFATAPVVALLVGLVRSRANVLVSGSTGAGKTTLLNALATAVPADERVVTIEDTAELRLPLPHVVRLEARPPSADGTGAVTLRDLVRTVLRMRPDRIVVGECRGGEALDLVQAMHTGHRGTLGTIHANGPLDALRRLETLVLLAGVGLPVAAVRDQVDSALDAVVHVARGADGARRVDAVGILDSSLPGRVRLVVEHGHLLAGHP
jgi:pilus assembly protein CpaF